MTSVAIVHWPCLDKSGREIASAVTNLDIHDGARACLTYGIETLYIVHPNPSQQEFARKIMDHWLVGFGSRYNPWRKRALEIVRIVSDLEEIRATTGAFMVGTTARVVPGCITWAELKKRSLTSDVCLVFGTGWGLAPGVFERLDAVVEPIKGRGDFNHLSVRCAIAVALDRIT